MPSKWKCWIVSAGKGCRAWWGETTVRTAGAGGDFMQGMPATQSPLLEEDWLQGWELGSSDPQRAGEVVGGEGADSVERGKTD